MKYSVSDFLHSLARYMVDQALAQSPSVVIKYSQFSDDGFKRDLWRNNAIEEQSNDPHAVLRIYGGPGSIKHPKPVVSVQCRVSGTDDDRAWALSQCLFET